MKGILLIDKPAGCTSFDLVRRLRKITGVQKIGHAGTLDPFATGVMVMLIGRDYTRKSDQFLTQDKEYVARLYLGKTTDSYDCDGQTTATSDVTPTREELEKALEPFQGTIMQVPPMFSAKKIGGKKLCDLARKGKTVERPPAQVHVEIDLLTYDFPHAVIRVKCSKGTYIRSLAHDIGQALGCGAHLDALQRTRSGPFRLEECLDSEKLDTADLTPHLKEFCEDGNQQ